LQKNVSAISKLNKLVVNNQKLINLRGSQSESNLKTILKKSQSLLSESKDRKLVITGRQTDKVNDICDEQFSQLCS
jgi:hypothetical protein